jgi:peptidoglycan hydrolase-like protein with peptidoglycan-binding domain
MSKTARIRGVQGRLRKIGFPIKADGVKGPRTRLAIREFQRGYARAKLPVDGEVRRISRTYRAIRWSAAHGGRCSKHFTFREFASKGNGWIKLDRRLVHALEVYRKRVGHGVEIVSGYRDCDYNGSIRGAARCSRHSDCCGNPGGDAADLVPELSFEQVRRLGVFTGIGIIRANGKVRHGDVRPGSVNRPTTWFYG